MLDKLAVSEVIYADSRRDSSLLMSLPNGSLQIIFITKYRSILSQIFCIKMITL